MAIILPQAVFLNQLDSNDGLKPLDGSDKHSTSTQAQAGMIQCDQ